MSERKHAGGRPRKRCYTYKNGEIREHEDIRTAAKYLEVSWTDGAYIFKMLREKGVYRPRNGGVCWPVGGTVSDELTKVLREWKRLNR